MVDTVEYVNGAVRLIDFMPIRGDVPDIVRIVDGIEGRVAMQADLVIRFDYGHVVPWVRRRDGALTAVAGPDALCLRGDVEVHGEDLATVGRFVVGRGERRSFALLRPVVDVTSQNKLRELILEAFQEYEERAAIAS